MPGPGAGVARIRAQKKASEKATGLKHLAPGQVHVVVPTIDDLCVLGNQDWECSLHSQFVADSVVAPACFRPSLLIELDPSRLVIGCRLTQQRAGSGHLDLNEIAPEIRRSLLDWWEMHGRKNPALKLWVFRLEGE